LVAAAGWWKVSGEYKPLDEQTLNLVKHLAVLIADVDVSRFYVEVKNHAGESAIVFMVSGNEVCDKLRPVLDKLCPRQMVRDGEVQP
jgi:hypothetical protein